MSELLSFKNSNRWYENEFADHVVSSAFIDVFSSNTLASFPIFFIDEIQISGDWRVTVSKIIFPTKIEIIVNGFLIEYNLKDCEDTQKMSAGANVISRPFSGQK